MMIADRTLQLEDLQQFLARSGEEDRRLRAVIESPDTPHEERLQALMELAVLSCDLTAILLEMIKQTPRS